MRRVASVLRPLCARPALVVRPIGVRAMGSAPAPAVRPAEALQGQSVAAEQSLRSYPATKITTLANGIRVATENFPGSGAATIGVYINAGSRNETDEQSGVAHFASRALRAHARPVAGKLAARGGVLSSAVGRETSVFSARVLSKDIGLAVEALGNVVSDRKVSGDLSSVRDDVLEEMDVVDNNMEEVVYDRLHETAFRGTALARPILGSVESVKALGAKEVNAFLANHYTGSRLVVSAAGAVDHQQLVELVASHFGTVPKAGGYVLSGDGLFTGSDIRIRHDFVPKAHAAVAFAIAGASDPDSYALNVIQHVLGSWVKNGTEGINSASYQIRQVARDELAEKLHTFVAPYSDIGLLGVYVKTDWMGQHQLFKNILYAITDLSYNTDELSLIEGRQFALTAALARLDSTAKISEDIGRQLLAHGRRIHPVEAAQRINAVDMALVKSVAQRFFLDRDPAFAAVGPIYEMPDYNWLRARTYFRRL